MMLKDGSEQILGSVHGSQPQVKFHETSRTPTSNEANFLKRAGDMSKTGR